MLQALLLQVTAVGMQPVSSTCSSQSSNPCSRPHRTPLPALRGPVVSQSRSRGHTPHCGKTVWGGEGEEVYAIVERVGSDATEGILCMFTHNNTCTSFPFQPNAALMHLVKCCLPADQCSTHKLRTNWNDTHIQTSKDTHSPKHSHIYSIPQHTHISTQSPTHSHIYSIPNTLTYLLNPHTIHTNVNPSIHTSTLTHTYLEAKVRCIHGTGDRPHSGNSHLESRFILGLNVNIASVCGTNSGGVEPALLILQTRYANTP